MMRLVTMLPALALLLAGCASPRMPSSVAEGLAAKADKVAIHLASGDGCEAARWARGLRADADDAIAAGEVPRPLADELDQRIAAVEDIDCVVKPTPTPAATSAAPAPKPKVRVSDDDDDDDDDKGGRGKGGKKKSQARGRGKG